MIFNLKKSLDVHQITGADYCLKHNYVIIGDGMGVGKTAQFLAVATTIKSAKSLIVCGKKLRRNWEREVKRFTFLRPLIVNKAEDIKKADKFDIFIISYSMLAKTKDFWPLCDLVGADEAHALKNPNTARTKQFDELLYDTAPSYCLLLTGTPIENKVPEFYNLLVLMGYNPVNTNGARVLDVHPTLNKFSTHFCYKNTFTINGRRIVKFKGFRKERKQDLKDLLKGKYYRRTKIDLGVEIREKDVFINYSQDPILQNEWDLFSQNRSKDSVAKTRSALEKSLFTVEYAEGVLEEDGGPILIFTDHLDSCAAIVAGLTARKYKVREITGKTSDDAQAEAEELFNGGKLHFLVITRAAREGLNFQAACHLIMNDYPWVPGWAEQVKKRIHRKGQTRDCLVHNIFGSYQDAHIKKINEEKQKIIEELL